MKKHDWKRLIERQKLSGLSVLGFCNKHQISNASFHYWRKNLAVDAGKQQLPVIEKDRSPTFTELVFPEVSQGVEMHFSGRVRVVASGSVAPVWLLQLILGHVLFWIAWADFSFMRVPRICARVSGRCVVWYVRA